MQKHTWQEEAPMAREREENLTITTKVPGDALSRRQVITAGLAAVGAGASALAATPEAAAAAGPIAVTPPGVTAAEFRARFAQTGPSGEHFAAYGYITRADGATDDDLFAGPSTNETTSLLTA